MKHFALLSVSLLVMLSALTAQPRFTDAQLAYEYYRNKEFAKAAVVYRDLYESGQSVSYLTMYLNCLFELQEFETAEQTMSREIKKNPGELSNLVELGYVYKRMGRDEEAQRQFDLALKRLPADQNQIQRLANAFRGKMENDYAEKTYLKGAELLGKPGIFNLDLAYVYQAQRRFDEMAALYFDLVLSSPANLANVQARLQNAVFGDVDNTMYDLLRNKLVRKIQENPDNTALSELLIWLYLQQNEYGKAFFQARALDRRESTDGKRILELARMAGNNNSPTEALEMYQYLIDKGEASTNYFVAKREWLGLQFNQLVSGKPLPMAAIDSLGRNYRLFLDKAGFSSRTALAMKELAHINAFYLGKDSLAIDLLEKTLSLNGMDSKTLAECKLELADIQVLTNDVWAAALTYGQIEKANENNPVGSEAKFRKARLAYFMGDFLWAKAQLDVLKASTSKFISNDSFDLSLLIETNQEEDTLETPMQMFARADLLAYQGRDSLALLTFDSVLVVFPGYALSDEVYFHQAAIHNRRGEFGKSAVLYQKIVDQFSDGILGDNALFALASVYETHLNDPEKAKGLYQDFLTRYPGSLFVLEVRANFRKLRGDLVE